MSTAILYIRVSTDEQATKGFSQRSQHDRLVKYCNAHEITISHAVFEDHSAKTFDRPAWKTLFAELKRYKSSRPNYILFTKWDRFSRNILDAYHMIAQLQRLGIQPQAIDQQLDMAIPENKIILAVYLATSEVENDRRSWNVRQGIHKAKQEGRWVAHLPKGYEYRLSGTGQKLIILKEPDASYLNQAFTLIARGIQPIQSVYEHAVAIGLSCSRAHFWRLIRNPFYSGRILVPSFEGEKEYFVQGSFQPLISESLFTRVQSMLDKKRIRNKGTPCSETQLPLRGFVHCPDCGKKLTGSGSQGKRAKYYYYHCFGSPCRFRVRADLINRSFIAALEKLTALETYKNIYGIILKQTRQALFNESISSQRVLNQHINRSIERILKAKELLMFGELEMDDFLLIKTGCEKRIKVLSLELQKATSGIEKGEKGLQKAILQLSRLKDLWYRLGPDGKMEFLNLFIADRALLKREGIDLKGMIPEAVQHIYGIYSENAPLCLKDEGHISEGVDNELLSTMISYEMTANRVLSIQEGKNIIEFLEKFAVLANK